MQKPVFSVIITTYNRKNILPRAIKSVLNQSYPHFELLVIDNGSTDGTQSVVSDIRDPRITYVRNPEPTDSCDAPRNLGLNLAKGHFVSFLDDDDIWYSERLKKVKKAFDDYPDASGVCHNEYRNINGRIEGIIKHGPWTKDIYERLLYEGNCLSPCAITLKAEVLRKLGGFTLKKEFSGAADYDLWIRMTAMGIKLLFIEEPLGEFTQGANNYSARDAAYGAKVATLAEMHILRYEKKHLLFISKRGMWRLFQLNAIAAKSYMRAGDGEYKRAFKHYAKAILFLLKQPSFIINIISRFGHGNK